MRFGDIEITERKVTEAIEKSGMLRAGFALAGINDGSAA
jgi:hypothetical protein